jgi:ribose/xylose/arabinose/galactoside ABC-type transport system permease subunit
MPMPEPMPPLEILPRASSSPIGLPSLLRRLELAHLRWLVAAVLAMIAFATPGFASWPSIVSLLTTVSFIGGVAVGMTMITISGNIMSFSLGATVGASSLVFVAVTNWAGLPAGLVVALLFGALLSAAQGLVVGLVRANPIIVSIAAMSIVFGVADALTQSATVYAAPGASYGFLKGRLLGLPIEFVVLLVLSALGQCVLVWTVFGRNLYMLGSSFRAAEAAGIRTWRTTAGAFAWAGSCSAVAGILLAIRYDGASMNYGLGYDYDAVAAVLVGGTLMKGGEGSIARTLAGALVIATIQVVLLLQGFRQEWQYLIAGLVVLFVIMLQTTALRSGGKRDQG